MKVIRVCLVTAFPAEAKPLIEHYGLKPVSEKPFQVYRKDHMWLIQSGLGKACAKSAVQFLFEHTGVHKDESIWLNVGVAGHKTRSIGEGILAHKVIDISTGRVWYPVLVGDFKVKTDILYTVSEAEHRYEHNAAYDMEASGFFEAASSYSTLELIHAYKVISDNPAHPIDGFSPKAAQKLIESHLKKIDAIVETLKHIVAKLPDVTLPEFHMFVSKWHFTETERHQLRKCLLQLKTLAPEQLAVTHYVHSEKAKDVLIDMRKHLESVPVSL